MVDDVLTARYGSGYFEQRNPAGQLLLGKKRVDDVIRRRTNEPCRYPRSIDAVVLGDLIAIMCDDSCYPPFRDAMTFAFPNGAAEARTFLARIEAPRNNLAHANGVALRAMEQVLCYSNDVIDSLKDHYRRQGMLKEFDVPETLRFIDSFGQVFTRAQLADNMTGGLYKNFSASPDLYLRPGDELTLEVDVDVAFDAPWKTIWQWTGSGQNATQRRAVIAVDVSHVGERFSLVCQVISKRDWHRLPSLMYRPDEKLGVD